MPTEDGESQAEATDPLIGASIAGYHVQELIGSGGMGAVYRAYDPALKRLAAIKLLLPQHDLEAEFKERFQREATLAAGINHPNVTAVYAFELTDDNRPALVMQYVEGSDLAAELDNGMLAFERALRIFEQIADALAHIHKQGLVHRDVKPDNVLLEAPGTETERALLTDFGIARATDSQTALTVGPIGTFEYMSPEVVDWEKATELSDQYSLACVLYRMLAGEILFGDLDLPQAHKSEDLPDLAKALPRLPPQSRGALSRALEKDPAKRYATVEAFAEDLMLGVGQQPADAPSLHETMTAVLGESAAMSAEDLAEAVNERRAGQIAPVTALQVEGRARLFSQHFAMREDGRLELRER